MTARKAVALRHVAFEDLGSLEPLLHQAGFEVEYMEAGYTPDLHDRAADSDLLVLLGGPISVNDGADYPFLAEEERLVRGRLERSLPTLGICLGAQLIAKVLGARVYKGPAPEIGWGPVTRSLEAAAHAVDHLVARGIRVLHWHGETFDLPYGATRLLSTPLYPNQAFEAGPHCLALQFHPEATRRGLERWLIGHCGEIAATPDISVGTLRADAAQFAEPLQAACHRFFIEWLCAAGLQTAAMER
jgi:GMP synthase (glutamine-hydrolysing)